MKQLPIKGFEGLYDITDDGRVYSHKTKRYLRGCKHSGGYVTAHLRKNDKRYPLYVHRLVLETFSPPTSAGVVTNHKNFNKADNRLENLEWTTQGDNVRHASAAFRHPLHAPRKLEPQIVELYPTMRTEEICTKLGVTKDTVMNVARKYFAKDFIRTRKSKLRPKRPQDDKGRFM